MTSFMKEFEHLQIQLGEIKKATNCFRNKVIGAGGFGAVYEGEVSHSTGRNNVAIKRLNRQFGQGEPEFLKEIMRLSRYTHQNLVSLLGFCDEEDEKVLVYEFASKGSLDRHLSDPHLTWVQRIRICLGAAKGLSYLHDPNGRNQRIIHCDIKSANILLDESLTAKVADFGLSKMGPANQPYSIIVTNALGTVGYCDPLYMRTYTLTKESDVYSFGVVLFEVLCGRLCYQQSNRQVEVLVDMWKTKVSENKVNEIVFEHLKPQMDPTSLELFSNIAFQCLHDSREGRPTMSIVVEQLESALEYQELPLGYKEILNAAVPPLRFTSIDDLNELFSNGVFLNAGKTFFSRNDDGEHYVLTSLAECLTYSNPTQYLDDYDSRFKVGSFSTYGLYFRIRVKTRLLSPSIIYRVNLVFKFRRSNEPFIHEFLPLQYTLNGVEKTPIVHLANKTEDEWLKASLYQFTSDERNVDLKIEFKRHHHYCDGLVIEGIEFQPLKKVEVELHQVLELKYGEIMKATTYSLIFKSEVELNVLLSKGVFFKEGKTWFSRNDKGAHYIFQSMKACLIREAGELYLFRDEYDSRFQVSFSEAHCYFKARAKTEFLSPLVTYTVNLVFKFDREDKTASKQGLIWLHYKLDGETHNRVAHFAHQRKDKWWTLELYHFISDGTTIDIEIIFEGCSEFVLIDGIEFQPLEKDELEVLEEDQRHMILEPTQSDSEDDIYWGNKLPTDYKDIIKFSEEGLQWTTKKELYHILFKGLMINYKSPISSFHEPTNHGQQWFCLDKNGKTCLMLPARKVICMRITPNKVVLPEWKSLPESRFGEGLVTSSSDSYQYRLIVIKQNKLQVLSPGTKYACYLVYKTDERGGCKNPMAVQHKDLGSGEWEYDSHIYLVSPQTPVISPNGGQNTYNPLYRPKLKGLPQQRSDGWMEVQVWEFQTHTTITVIPKLRLESLSMSLEGLMIIGIDFRPVYIDH